MDAGLRQAIEAAIAKREVWFGSGEVDAYRLFHGWTEGCPRLEIDRWGPAFTIDARPSTAPLADEVAELLRERFAPELVSIRVRGDEPEDVVLRSVIVEEHGARYAVEPERRGNPGLYLDARPARAWIRSHSEGRRVLNLFAFTGSLGLAASMGGAGSVTHVDKQRSSLARTAKNYQLNGLRIGDRDLVRLNIYHHLRRASARRQRYDAIILDTPPYVPHADRTPGGRGAFAVAEHAGQMLAPGAWMLCFFHHHPETHDELDERLLDAVPGAEVLWRNTSGDDFPEDDPTKKTRMTAIRR